MKKLFIAAALLLSSSAIFAQTKFGVKGGVNFANVNVKEDESPFSMSPSSITSFHVTGLADIPVSSIFSLQPGLSFTGKGFKVDMSEDGNTYKATANVYYLEIPINAVAKFPAGSGKFFIGAGPYAGIGLTGKTKTETSGDIADLIPSEKKDIKFGNNAEEDDLKRADLGLNFLAGYELNNGLTLNGGYGLGLTNLEPKGNGASSKHKVFSISVGFLF